MFSALKKKFRNDPFITTPISIVMNPFYIIRNGLYKHIRNISPNISGDILDVGCGIKPYEFLFKNAKSYVGVDMNIESFALGQDKNKIDYFYDGETLPFPNESFDAVVCFEVFEHVFNLDESLAEIRRVLKPDGQLLLSIPFAWDEHLVPYDFARYTSFGIAHILEKNGFEITITRKTTTYVLAVFQMAIAYLSQHVSPTRGALPVRGVLGVIFQLFIIFPLNVTAHFFNALLPKRYQYFCNTVVLSKKVAPQSTQE